MKFRFLHTLRILALSLMAFMSFHAPAAHATSQNECAIWLCLPGGFPATCGAAHAAMMDRIKDLKSPLPPYSDCLPGGSGAPALSSDLNVGDLSKYNLTHVSGIAAYVPAHRECARWSGGDADYCMGWKEVPAQYYKNQTCSRAVRPAWHGQVSCRQYRFIDVIQNGQPIGSTYYY